MKQKRYIRILMSKGYSRNEARRSVREIIRYNEVAGKHRCGNMRSYAEAEESRLWFARLMVDYLRRDVKTK
jgi:hypothetical protein